MLIQLILDMTWSLFDAMLITGSFIAETICSDLEQNGVGFINPDSKVPGANMGPTWGR